MILAASLLHGASWHWNLAAWLIGPVLLVIGLAGAQLVTALMRPGRGALERSLFALTAAAAALPPVAVGLRLFEQLQVGFGPGPQHWLVGWLPGMHAVNVHAYDAVVATHTLACAAASAVAVASALIAGAPRRPSLPAPVPGRNIAAAVLLLVAMATPLLAWYAYPELDPARLSVPPPQTLPPMLLEWVGMLPAIALCMAGRLYARNPPAVAEAVRVAAPADTGPPPDPRALWIAAGLLAHDAAPLARVRPRSDDDTPTDRATAAWTAVDAPGRPPRALDELLEQVPDKEGLFVLGGLPRETEDALWGALLADLVATRGLRALMVSPDPASHAQRLEQAMRRARTWEPGTVAVGTGSLREALAGSRVPVLTLLTVDELGAGLVRLAAGSARAWTTGLDLILVHRPDLGTPLELSHTAFAFRRWDLATRRMGRPPVVASAAGTRAHLGYLERLFPGRAAQVVALGPRARGGLVVWPGLDAPAAEPWVARSSRAITEAGLPVGLLDTAGRWGNSDLPRGTTLHREPAWPEAASSADVAAGAVVDAYRTLENRLVEPEEHHSLWRVATDPVSRFLTPARLAALADERQLPGRVPVVGTRNRFLRLAHLDAALKEAANDERSLRAAFGDDLVDFKLRAASGAAERATVFVAWRDGAEVVRAPLLQSTTGDAWKDPRSTTVTTDVVQIVEERTGDTLALVDARMAPTRYYPKRVLAVGQRRYRVPMHAYDAKRRQLTVEAASARDRLTRPVLSFKLSLRRVTVERVSRRHGSFEAHTLSAECVVEERVHAAWVPGGDQEDRFEPVSASYDTEIRLIHPATAKPGPALFHLAATVEALLPVHLRCEADDVAVTTVPAGFASDMGPGLAVVDRHVAGMGFARALDDAAVVEVLRWSRRMLYTCKCMEGCSKCTPPQVLRVGPAKQAVLAMLEGL